MSPLNRDKKRARSFYINLQRKEDKKGLIDGIAVSEPNLSPRVLKKLVIRQGDRQWMADSHSKLLYDYFSFINVYQTCADLAQPDASLNTGVLFPNLAANRCASLAEIALLTESTTAEQASEAQQVMFVSPKIGLRPLGPAPRREEWNPGMMRLTKRMAVKITVMPIN